MKLTWEQRRMIALAAGILLVLIGFVPDLLNFGIDKETTDTIIFTLVVIGGVALIGGRKRKGKDQQEGPQNIEQVNNITEKKNTPDN